MPSALLVLQHQDTANNNIQVYEGDREEKRKGKTLFNLFLEFVLNELAALDNPPRLQDDLQIAVKYADDTTLIATSIHYLQLLTEQLEAACRKFGLKINGAKCNIISKSNEDI